MTNAAKEIQLQCMIRDQISLKINSKSSGEVFVHTTENTHSTYINLC